MTSGMSVVAQAIITAAAVLAAVITIFKNYNKIYDLVRHQEAQDRDIKAIKAEQSIMTYGVLACLKGLQELGCDGAVTDAITKVEKHLNEAAHGQI